MKLIVFALIGASFLAAAEKPGKDARIPAGAVKVDENTSKYTDASGKKWIYRTTPFGVAKYEDKDPTPEAVNSPERAARASLIKMTKAREEKGIIYFEQPGPFGPIRWSRAKNALTDEEKAIWESQKKSAGSQEPRN